MCENCVSCYTSFVQLWQLNKTSKCHTDDVNYLENNWTNKLASKNTDKQHTFWRKKKKLWLKSWLMWSSLCFLSHLMSPSVPFDLSADKEGERDQYLTCWPPAYKKVNKSNSLYEVWIEQVAKHTESLVGTFQIFIHTMLSNLHRGNSAELARPLRWWQLATTYCTDEEMKKAH